MAEHYRPERQNRSKGDNEIQSRRSSTSCVKKAKTGTCSELSFPDSCAKSSTASVPLSTSSACTVVTFARDEKIPQVLIGTEPEHFLIDEFESDLDTDYDETESEQIVEHRNAITSSGRQIKASVRFDL